MDADDSQHTGHLLSSLVIMSIVSSLAIVVFILGFLLAKYRHRDERDRRFNSTSCESLTLSSVANETTRFVKNSFSWPETTPIFHQQIHESQTVSLSSTSSTLESSPLASITFTLRWDEMNHLLFIRIVNARNLYRHRQSMLIDSYIRIELFVDQFDSKENLASMRTHIVKKNSSPVFDELFQFDQIDLDSEKNYLLIFTVSTYDTFTRDDILGELIFPLTRDRFQSTEMTFTNDLVARREQLASQPCGQILLSLCYQPLDKTLTIVVLKAANLPRLGSTRLLNPYLKIYMFYKKQRIMKKRTSIQRSTQCPVYNECFPFEIPENDLDNVQFDLILFDYDRHMKHQPIGICSIGKDHNEHWIDVCQRHSSKQIAQWYQLKSLENFH